MDKKSNKNKIEIRCPHCKSLIVVDIESGEILYTEKFEKKEFKSLDEVLEKNLSQKKDSDNTFKEILEKEKRRKEILEKKFSEVKEKKKDDNTPPKNIFDFD